MKIWITVKIENGITSYETTWFQMAMQPQFDRIAADAVPDATIVQYEVDLHTLTVHVVQSSTKGSTR